MGRNIVVFGTKGGVGKSVVAVNLAVGLAKRVGRPCCLVELDLMAMGDIAKMLNLNPARSLSELPALVQRGFSEQVVERFLSHHPSGMDVLVSKPNPREGLQVDPHLISQLLQWLKQRYEYVVVDGGKAFTDPLIAAFEEANLIILVVTPDIVSLYQTRWMVGTIESLMFPSSMIKVLLNRAESRGGVGSEDVKEALSCEVVGFIPSDGRTVGLSVNQGEPLLSAYGHTKVAEAFRRLADVLVERPGLYIEKQAIPRHRAAMPKARSAGGGPDQTDGAGRKTAETPQIVEDEVAALKQRIHEQLIEELDLKKLDLASMSHSGHFQQLRERTERIIANLLVKEMGGIVASHEVRIALVKEIADEALGLGPLEEYLQDPEVTDILVNTKDQIYVERRGKLELTGKKFLSDEQVRTVIERIVAPVGRRIDEANPMVDARLPDGSRVNAIIPPLSLKGAALSIRKFARERLTLDDLERFGSLNRPMVEFLRACVLGRKNLIISGGTGSGKTTLLNVLSAFIPPTERIVTIEDSAELKLSQTHWISLEGRPPNMEGKGEVSVRELFRNSMRMRPDRVIIGECRGEETLDMLQAMNTGHDGSLTTVHANSPRDVVRRLDSLVLMSKIELPLRAIREMVASAIHMIIHTARMSDGSRKITVVSELVDIVDGTEINFRDLFLYTQQGVAPDGAVIGEFSATGQVPTFLDELKVKGIPVSEEIFRAGA